MQFYFSASEIGKYFFDFRPDSDEDQEAYESQETYNIGKGRTVNIVRMDKNGASYDHPPYVPAVHIGTRI